MVFKTVLVLINFLMLFRITVAIQDCAYGLVFDGASTCIECGLTDYEPNIKIVGGVDAIPYSWPAHVQITEILIDGTDSFICGGTLITRNAVLTAAHCVKDNVAVHVGLYDIENETGTRYTVSNIFKHPDYSETNLQNDIAIFILSKKVTLTPKVKLACLPAVYSTSYPIPNEVIYAVGWGTTTEAGFVSSLLQNVALKVYASSMCNDVYPTLDKNWNSQICAGNFSGGQDTCQGDSGGGIYSYDLKSSKSVVSGVVSYGDGCAREGLPGIYTRTSYYLSWINSIVFKSDIIDSSASKLSIYGVFFSLIFFIGTIIIF